MILFIFGPDTYRSRLKLKEIIEHYKKIHKSGLNLISIDLEEKNYQDFISVLKVVPMFKEKKLIILENIISNQEFQEKFLKEIKKFVLVNIIILIYEGEIQENKFSRSLKEKSDWQNFNYLKEEELKFWIKKEFKKKGCEIENRAVEKLIEFVGNDLWQMENEINKLISYKEKIGLDDVELLVKSKIESNIFEVINAIAQKNKRQALTLVHENLEKGGSPFLLLSMINFQFRNIILVKDLIEKRKPFKEAGLHPYTIQKTLSLANKFSFPELKKIYQKIFKIDLDTKSGRLNPEIALDLLVAEL